mmetsp:Transcript_21681/g.49938  ORF Transcript_21681/g.49938 Transcript_21681/m.49938 type:complete len:216 (-) Transcript_21681:328-975(-)|eukprot:CAMPEP_0119492452 /NCGR_PEP_ID=MMETSP1344-20130328/16998_1 /TAXON_ID=236787 /ORGANISM="Florenciella parvula, Strain CCMP2471" /LENGTH=215 /DNA_ID=CAMNT_0007527783 /DNA_START=245 /DNA_END=892 /DNA_ORIENTATION=+
MGAGASVPATREEALAQGYTEEQIRKYMSQMGEEKNQQEYENRPDHLKAFLTACSEGDLETVRTLVENENVDIETKSMSGAPGVFFAAQGGFVPVLEYLNDRDANFKASDFGGSTPFHEASRKGHPDAIEFMCSMAAGRVDIHKTDGQGWNALTCAAAAGHLDTVRLLLDKGVSADVQDVDGKTALDWAGITKRSDVVEFLSSLGSGAGGGAEAK